MKELRAFIKIGFDEYFVPVAIPAYEFMCTLVKLQPIAGGEIRATLTYRLIEEVVQEEKENDLESNTKND